MKINPKREWKAWKLFEDVQKTLTNINNVQTQKLLQNKQREVMNKMQR